MVIKNSTRFVSSVLLCGILFTSNFSVHAAGPKKNKVSKNDPSASGIRIELVSINNANTNVQEENPSNLNKLKFFICYHLKNLERTQFRVSCDLLEEIRSFIDDARAFLDTLESNPSIGPENREVINKIRNILDNLELELKENKSLPIVALERKAYLSSGKHKVGDLGSDCDPYRELQLKTSSWFDNLVWRLNNAFGYTLFCKF